VGAAGVIDLRALIYYSIAILVSISVVGATLAIMGYDIVQGYVSFLFSGFIDIRSLGLFSVKFTSLYLLGLAFSIPLAARRFNVGNEGQFLLGAIGASIAGILFGDIPAFILIPAVLLFSVLLGLLWSSIPALLLYVFKVNEIVSTILLNFIAFQLVNYVALSPLRDVFAGHPMTIPISESARLSSLIGGSSLNAGLSIAIVCGVIIYIYTYRTVYGYELQAAGANPIAASKHGINAKVLGPMSLAIGGVFAGLAGGIEVAGYHYRLIEGMQGFYAPLSIIAALMAKGDPRYLLLSSFYVTLVDIGSSALQRTLGVPAELSLIIAGLSMLLIMIAEYVKERR